MYNTGNEFSRLTNNYFFKMFYYEILTHLREIKFILLFIILSDKHTERDRFVDFYNKGDRG